MGWTSKRLLPPMLGLTLGLLMTAACSGTTDDDAVTDSSAEFNARSSLERELKPTIAPPTSGFIGASTSDVIQKSKANLTVLSSKTDKDSGCRTTIYKDTKSKPLLTIVECETSIQIRLRTAQGMIEHSDLNKDGKIDRYANDDGLVAQYIDRNYDGKIDVVVERVELIEDFSLAGYGEDHPKSTFLFRIREDSNRDGKLDLEKLTVRGLLAPAEDAQEQEQEQEEEQAQ